jgi:hypothetical protein
VLIAILKYSSQLIMLISGVLGAVRAHSIVVDQANQTRRITKYGLLSIVGIIVGFVLFIATDWNDQQRKSKEKIAQQNVITELQKAVIRTREIEGIEISFTPSAQDWVGIEEVFKKIPSPTEIPYSAATMKAERTSDSWKISFEPVTAPQGLVKFPPIVAKDKNYTAFQTVIEKACPSVWINWGADVQTDIEPRGKLYPAAITISRASISIILRSPELKMRLSHLVEGLTVMIRNNGQPSTLRFISLDPDVTLDQTLNVQWREDTAKPKNDNEDYLMRTKPYVSGPHKLKAALKI